MATPVRPNLTIDISENDNDNNQQQSQSSPQQQLNSTLVDGGSRDPKTPPGVRGHSDIRAPGFAKTPLNADTTNGGVRQQGFTNELDPINSIGSLENTTTNSPSNLLPSNNDVVEEPRSPLADFITQTDKYGNASTPRSATAIQTARKLHPEGPKPVLHVENGTLTEETSGVAGKDDSSDGGDGNAGVSKALLSPSDKEKAQIEAEKNVPVGGEDACDTLLDNFRMMCCCLLPEDNTGAHTNSDTANQQGGTDSNLQKSTHSTSSTENSDHNNTQNTSIGPHGSYPLGYSTRGHDAPLLLEEDSALRNNPRNIKLLPNMDYSASKEYMGKKCLVLDLDETLVHSSFRAVPGADFVIPVQIEDVVHFVYVAKRPGVDEFLIEMAKHYEIVVYTASLNKYADVLLDLLDPHRVIRTRLFRESCVFYEGNYVKDLCLLNRDLSQCIIIDNSPASYMFHPENAIDCGSFIDDVNDRELDQIGAFLTGLKDVPDVRGTVNLWRHWPNVDLTKNHRRIR